LSHLNQVFNLFEIELAALWSMVPSFLFCGLLAWLPFVISFHKQGFSYTLISNNPKTSHIVTSAARVVALHGQTSNIQTRDLKTVLHISQSAMLHHHAKTTHFIWSQAAHLPAALECSRQGSLGTSLQLSSVQTLSLLSINLHHMFKENLCSKWVLFSDSPRPKSGNFYGSLSCPLSTLCQ